MEGAISIDTTAIPIVDLRGEVDEALLRRAYDEVYLPAFPVAAERESVAEWEQLLWGADRGPPAPRLHVLIAHDGGDAVHGLVVGEYYRQSNCGLISYVAVSGASRGGGLGYRLMTAIIDVLDADARAVGGTRLGSVFAEVHDPSRAPLGDSMDPVARLRFMARCGARVIPVAYVQPQLASGEDRVRNLLLVVFPVEGQLSDLLPSSTVMAFLDELYRALGVPKPAQDEDFSRMVDALAGETTELLALEFRKEAHELEFRDYALAVHLVLDREPGETRLPPRSAHLDSFEQDMLAYAFRGAPPLRTALVRPPDNMTEVELSIPPVMTYRAEGRLVVLVRDAVHGSRPRRLRVRSARTDFLRSGLSVLHIIFTPGADPETAALSEHDIVKLIKIWEGGEGLPGPGERQDWLGFRPLAGPAVAFIDLAAQWLGERRVRHVKNANASTTYRVGTIQLLTATSTQGGDESLTAELMADIVRLREDPGAFSDARRHDEVAWRRLKAVGGIIQGLLDFEEVDESELSDVFSQFEGDTSSQLGFHKGTLLHVAPSDRVWETTREYLGISPYLIVAHGVVLHNEVLLKEAALLVAEALQSHSRRRWPRRPPIRALRAKRVAISRCLDEIVPNVMHYEQERSIYDHGHQARRLTDLDAQVRGGLDRSAITVEARVSDRATLAGVLIGILITLITAATFLPKWSIPALIVAAGGVYYLFFWMSFRQSA